MQISTHSKHGPVEKTVNVGDGVAFVPDGSRYTITAEVLEIDEERRSLRVKGIGFEGWMSADRAHDVLPMQAFQRDESQRLTDWGSVD